MKIAEPLFIAINPLIGLILRSPLHSLLSGSLMLITYKGRKSQKVFTTPVRYVRANGTIRCFTSPDTLWWRNLRGGAEVTLRMRGKDVKCLATTVENDPQRAREALDHYLALFPQDAAYYDIARNQDESLVVTNLDSAANNVIVVEAKPVKDMWK
jgi:F420H(2)-dependent quinone reductase